MKGVIFKHFESFVAEQFSQDAYEALLERTPLRSSGTFVGPRTYPDEDLFALVGAAVEMTGLALEDAVFAFGDFLYPRLAGSVPEVVGAHADTKALLMALDRVIHVEVRKILPEAMTPRILCEDTGPDSLRVQYESPRKLCALFRGLVNAAARSYGQAVECTEEQCMHHGAAACTLALRFSRLSGESA